MRRNRVSICFAALAFALAACASPAGAPHDDTPVSRTSLPSRTANTPTAVAPTAESSTATSAPTSQVGAAATAPPAQGTGRSVTISAVGDVSLARQVNDWMAQYGAGYPYELITPLLTATSSSRTWRVR